MARNTKKPEQDNNVEDQNDIVKIVARRLQEARIKTGLTQTQVGEKAGLKQSYVFELEFGDTNPTLRTLEKVAKAIDVDLRDLLPGAPGAPPSEADVKHVMVALDRLSNVVETYLSEERQRVEREEARRVKQEVVLLESMQSIAQLRSHLRPLIKLAAGGDEPGGE